MWFSAYKLRHNPTLGKEKIRIGDSLTAMEYVESILELPAKISELTDKIAGTNNNILNQPIYVEIESADCPELTLIDLPGIAKNPIANSDQGEDIEEITKGLIEEYIKVWIVFIT